MKPFYFSVCFFLVVSAGNAQSRITDEFETLQKIQAVKPANSFLTARAAFELYKKINKSAIADTPVPAGNARTYSFIWPQLKDGDNELFFINPITSVSNNSISLTNGDIAVQIPSCNSAGFYMLQINCVFQNSGSPEMKLLVASGVNQQTAAVSMPVTQYQATNFVLGVNLARGTNVVRINCSNVQWRFYSLKISPLQ